MRSNSRWCGTVPATGAVGNAGMLGRGAWAADAWRTGSLRRSGLRWRAALPAAGRLLGPRALPPPPRFPMRHDEASVVPPYNSFVTDERARPPLHTLLVHFPFVLWGMSFVFDLASYWRGPAMVEAALFNLVAGLAAAAAAAVTGVWDYLKRLPPGSTARRIARWHALANATATALFVASLVLRWPARGALATPRGPFVLSALGVALLGVASYLGGLCDYEYAVTTRHRSPDAR